MRVRTRENNRARGYIMCVMGWALLLGACQIAAGIDAQKDEQQEGEAPQ